MMGTNSHFPRHLTERERTWLEWILPVDRNGYREHREVLSKMVVLGEGRRGKGDIILGFSGDIPDTSVTLPPVFAYGVIETNFGPISITVRENYSEQIDVEIVSQRGEEVPDEFEESRRWTYSTWNRGDACPQCMKPVREVSMHTQTSASTVSKSSGQTDLERKFILAICAHDKRLWVYDDQTQVNHIIPVTNFYNELMLHKKVRDPKIALDSKRLFNDLSSFTDAELTYAFLTYNKIKTKVEVRGSLVAERKEKTESRSFLKHLLKLKKKA